MIRLRTRALETEAGEMSLLVERGLVALNFRRV